MMNILEALYVILLGDDAFHRFPLLRIEFLSFYAEMVGLTTPSDGCFVANATVLNCHGPRGRAEQVACGSIRTLSNPQPDKKGLYPDPSRSGVQNQRRPRV
jgi:hypothetical protein